MTAATDHWSDDLLSVAPGADPDAVPRTRADLVRRWAEPHRRYHNGEHLVEVLVALDELVQAGAVQGRDAVWARLAGWFHDAVYAVPDPGTNESESAALAARSLHALGCPADTVDAVARLVRATQQHERPLETGPDAAFHDADLWILSAPRDRFEEYCGQVRDEYAMVPDAAYAVGRVAVLRPFLAREAIYATAHAHASWEHQARANLRRELDRLA